MANNLEDINRVQTNHVRKKSYKKQNNSIVHKRKNIDIQILKVNLNSETSGNRHIFELDISQHFKFKDSQSKASMNKKRVELMSLV